MITEVPIVAEAQEAPVVVVDDNAGIPEVTEDVAEVASQEANQGTDTSRSASLNNSIHSSDNLQSDSMNADPVGSDSNAPDSSRGSTKVSGTDAPTIDDIMYPEDLEWMAAYNFRMAEDDEPDSNEDGSKNLTKKYLRELFAKNFKKYYRTPSLNEKLYLHYKGFSKMNNLDQFVNLKCLYFEGNGCDSLLGLEKCTKLRSLYIQENVISKIEGIDTLSDLV